MNGGNQGARSHRRQHTQAVAAAKAGISERSARRIENDPQLPSQKKKERHWRTRADPLEPFWPRVEELLQIDGIIAVTVFETLQDEFGEDAVPDAIRRTLERRIARWRALHGGEKEIFFPQHHEPGRQGLSDFTVCDSLKVTVAGETLAYRLYHFRLPSIELGIEGLPGPPVGVIGEQGFVISRSFQCLRQGLQMVRRCHRPALRLLPSAPLQPQRHRPGRGECQRLDLLRGTTNQPRRYRRCAAAAMPPAP